jgi:hypothetical protein
MAGRIEAVSLVNKIGASAVEEELLGSYFLPNGR